MKHILTTNEPFLLERGEESVDLMNLKILDWTELPWWLNGTYYGYEVDDCVNPTSRVLGPYAPMAHLDWEKSTPIEEDRNYIQFASRFNSIYGVRFSQTYEAGYEESNMTSELGKLVDRYFGDRPGLELRNPILIWDIANGKVYRVKIIYSNGSCSYKVIFAVDYQYNPDRIYSYPMAFDTKIYFKFRFTAEEIPSYISNPDESDPDVWLYKIDLIPVYHDLVPYNSAWISEPYMTISDINQGEGPIAGIAAFLKGESLGTYTGAIISPCLYFNLGEVSDQIKFRSDGCFFNPWCGISLMNLPSIGRFTAGIDNLPIVFNGGLSEELIISDSNPSIVEGHTYEYHYLNGVFSLIDITGEAYSL